MLYHLLTPLSDLFHFFNIFKYITFRTGGAVLTSFIISFLCAPYIIKVLKNKQKEGQPIREDGPQTHFVKKGTPTMGGLIIMIGMIPAVFLWSNLLNPFIWSVLLITLSFGAIGAFDDFQKLKYKNSKGLSGKKRLFIQTIFALISIYIISYASPEEYLWRIVFPFSKEFYLTSVFLFIPFAWLVLVGTSHAVNLTDGLDGLVSFPLIMTAACYIIISYIVGNYFFSKYLYLPFIPGTGELCILCGAMFGSILGFLWYNTQPAQVFMGDTGSLAMGGTIGAISICTKHEIVLSIIGGLFVIETLSVILQVLYFKKTGGKRIFLMAPLHHHFEKKGWSESTVVVRFWIISILFAFLGLLTLKLR